VTRATKARLARRGILENRVSRGILVPKERRVAKVFRGNLGSRAIRVLLVRKAIPALRGFKENRGFKVLRGFQGKRVRPGALALKGILETWEPPEQKATRERLVLLVPKETPEKRGRKESKVFKAFRAKLVRKGFRGRLGQKVILGQLVRIVPFLAHKGNRGFKARLEVPVPAVSRVFRVFRESKEKLARRAQRVIRATRGQKAIRAILA
jgi:hypothetical protein